MAYLDHSSDTIVVDAVLTKKGRKLLVEDRDKFKITKFAVADDGIDYDLWNPNHPNGTNYYGEKIENIPLFEANPNEDTGLRYKLTTYPRTAIYLATIQNVDSSYTILEMENQVIEPATSDDIDEAYTVVWYNTSILDVIVTAGGDTDTGTNINLNIEPDSNTAQGTKFKIKALRNLDLDAGETTNTYFNIIGNKSGVQKTVNITIEGKDNTTYPQDVV